MYNLSTDKKYLNNTGLSHDERKSEALNPEYFAIDEIDLNQFIHFVSKYSKLLSYYNEQKKLQGDWSAFFVKDPTFCVLRLSSFKSNKLNKSLLKELVSARMGRSAEIKANTLVEQGRMLIDVLISVEQNLVQLDEYRDFREEMTRVISLRLSTSLHRLFNVLQDEISGSELEGYRSEFSNYWLQESDQSSLENQGKDLQHLDQNLADLEELALSTFRVLNLIAIAADEYFEKNLVGSGLIKPHIALLLTFHGLYSHASNELNKITRKHLHHYYTEVLQMTARKGETNQAFLSFELEEGSGELEILKDEEFLGGTAEDGQDILYRSVETSVLQELTLNDIYIVHNDTDLPELTPLSNLEGECQIFKLGTVEGRNEQSHKNDWIEPSTVGFTFGCDLLDLDEGYRKINFEFHSEHTNFQRFLRELEERSLDGLSEESIKKSLSGAFSVSYSNEEEMCDVNPDKVETRVCRNEFGEWKGSFEIAVLVDIVDPAVNVLPEDSESAEKSFPFFDFVLNSEKMDLNPVFDLLKIEKVTVEVEVLEAQNLMLSNDFGPLDPTAPFEPFGSQPTLGASFFIGHPIMFNYSLEDIKLSIEWQGLPGIEGGFAEYYAAYHEIGGNDSFKVKLSALREKRWLPAENNQIVDLFRTVEGEEGEIISPIRRLNEISAKALELDKPMIHLGDVAEYSSDSISGFLKMELCFPLVSFGHDLYPELITSAALIAAKSKKDLNYPNEPYTPVIKNISADFKAKMSYTLEKESDYIFKQIHPFGRKEISSFEELIPRYQKGSSLLIGLDHYRENTSIALLFELNAEYSADKSNGLEREWYVWADFEWLKLEPGEITRDTTLGFKKSGIVELNIERGSYDRTGLLNSDLIWLKCQTTTGHSFVEGIADVLPNGLLVECATPELLQDPNIVAGTVDSLRDDRPGISLIQQKYPSFGGRSEEEDLHFYQRVSERLKHKDRAVSVRDYEFILLDRFRDLYRVKCFPNTNGKLGIAPGEVLVTVIPHLSANDSGATVLKYFSNVELAQMSDYINQRVPLGVKLNIVNPIYEKVRTKFNVQFVDGFDPTYYSKKLNDEIKQFLSPFLAGDEEQMVFDKSIQSTQILNFVDGREYVDFVVNFSVFHLVNGIIINQNDASLNSLEIVPTTGISILVSDETHNISLHDDENVTDVFGINEMMIETDYIVEEQEADGSGHDKLVLGKNYRVLDADSEINKEKSNFTIHLQPE